MASFGKHFEVSPRKGISASAAIKQGNFYRITILTERLVRLEYSKDGYFNDLPTDFAINRNFPVPSFKLEEDDKYVVITTKYFELQYQKEKPFKGPSFAPDANLKVKLLNTDKTWYYGHPEARNYLASSMSLDNFRGSNKLQKGLYSTDGFVSINDKKPLTINELGILVNSPEDNDDIYLFMYKRDFGLCLKDYFTLTGYPALVPRYALGIWWYRDTIYSFEDTKKLVEQFQENDVPLNVLMLGEFWHEKDPRNYNLYKSGYHFSKALFKNPDEFIKYMHDRGIRVGIQLDSSEGIYKTDPLHKIFSQELGREFDGNIPFNAFDKMFIITYFENIVNPLLNIGIDFFWLDYSKDVRSLRALSYYHIKDFDKDDAKRPMLFARNPMVGAHRNTVLYSGETIVSWNTLKYLPYFNSSASNMGLSWWSHDVGGFKEGTEDAELYLRYVEFSCFNPIFRFSAQRGAYYKREPFRWDFKTYNIVKNYLNLRLKLIPYIYSEGYNYAKEGLPLIQPLYYMSPEFVDDTDAKNEYYFGRNLVVSPITTPKDKVMNRVIHRVLLPKGTFYEFTTGKKFVGNNRYVTFYQDEDYPVFAKAGSIIPLSLAKTVENPTKMEIMVFPGDSSIYELYEDDGITSLYKDGYFIKTGMEFTYKKNNYSLSIHPNEGKTNIIPKNRDYKIVFRNTKDVKDIEVFINEEKISNITTSYEKNSFVVWVNNVDTTKHLKVVCKGDNIEIDANQVLNDDINSIINDLNIPTKLKEHIAAICFSKMELKKKRIAIKKLKSKGLTPAYIKMFMKLYDSLKEL